MGFVVQTDMPQKLRFLLFGLANSGKTQSEHLSRPAADCGLSGRERDHVPPQREDITNYVYQVDVDERNPRLRLCMSLRAWSMTRVQCDRTYAEHRGPAQTLRVLPDIVTSGAYFDGKEFDSKLYGPAIATLQDLSIVSSSPPFPLSCIPRGQRKSLKAKG